MTAGKYIFGDSRIGVARFVQTTDRVQQHYTVISELIAATAKKCVVEVEPDMLKHANRNDPVEASPAVSIILYLERNSIAELSLGGPATSRCYLFFGQADARYMTGSGNLNEIKSEPSPTTADLEYPLSAATINLAATWRFFASCAA